MAESHLTLGLITGLPAPTGTAPAELRWSPDGRQLAFLWDDTGRHVRNIWLVERDAAALVCLTRALRDVSDAGDVTDLAWAPGSDAVVFLYGGDVWEVAAPGGTPRRLTQGGVPDVSRDGVAEIGISPDGSLISFLEDGDLWLLPRAGGPATRATAVGRPPVGKVPLGTYHRPDVEIGPATWGAPPSYAWSPDGRYVAVHLVDRRHVPTMSLPYYLGEAPVMNVLRRGRPGDVNESRTIGFYDVEQGSLHLLDLPMATDTRIVSFAWSPAGTLLIDRETDDAVDRHLLLADPDDGSVTQIWHDHRESRIYNDIASAWHGDGRRILVSGDLDDRYRLHLFEPSAASQEAESGGGGVSPDLVFCAGSVRVLTSGPFDVTGPGIPVPGTTDILYVSSEPTPSERHVWRIDEHGTAQIRLTTRPGTHAPFLSPDGRTLALLSSDDVTPTELYLTSAEAPAEPRRITHSRPQQFHAVTWQAARYVTFPHRADRYTVHARVIEPPHLDRSKKHPVIFGNMYSNTVRNRWEPRFAALQQYLVAERGYIVVQVDVRGSTGYGRDFREAFLMDWGGGDLEDIESAVDHLKTLPYVDPERLGIWGTSYGGTLTIYSLLRRPGLFRAGVAAAPAVDPYFFGSDDVAICRRPQTHPHTFTRGALQYAANLEDHLLIIHGMQDDVVPFQTSVALAEELMRRGKDFEVAFAPAATHAWSQRPDYALHLMRRLVGHFDRHLAG
jgi:dipeptidyl-peptidase-4